MVECETFAERDFAVLLQGMIQEFVELVGQPTALLRMDGVRELVGEDFFAAGEMAAPSR